MAAPKFTRDLVDEEVKAFESATGQIVDRARLQRLVNGVLLPYRVGDLPNTSAPRGTGEGARGSPHRIRNIALEREVIRRYIRLCVVQDGATLTLSSYQRRVHERDHAVYERDAATAALNAAVNDLAALTLENRQLTARLRRERATVEELTAENADISEELARRTAEVTALRTSFALLERRYTDLQRVLEASENNESGEGVPNEGFSHDTGGNIPRFASSHFPDHVVPDRDETAEKKNASETSAADAVPTDDAAPTSDGEEDFDTNEQNQPSADFDKLTRNDLD